MFEFLKPKKMEVPSITVVDEKREELATVQVRDIKQYLVDEYDRAKKLEERNEYLRSEVEKAKELQLKYDASLVLLDEYKGRLESYEKKLLAKDKMIEECQEAVRIANESVNDYKITLSRAALTKEDIQDEIVKETKSRIVQRLYTHRGNLSKMAAIEIVKEA